MLRSRKITSASNPLIKNAARLKEKRTGLRSDFLIEGQHIIEMAVSADAGITQVFFTDRYRSGNEAFLESLPEKGCDFIETTDHIISKLSDTETPQGIVAVVSYKTCELQEISLGRNPLVVVCDGVQDPGNLGTIIRTADASGVAAVILLPGTCDALASKAIRASAGSIFNLPVISSDQGTLIQWLKEKQIVLIAADVSAPSTIYEAELHRPLAFAFGNEAHGVSRQIREKADKVLAIPLLGKAESLNVSVSAGICLYEAVRQRKSRF